MVTGTEALRQALADYLTDRGVAAVTAWPQERRAHQAGAVAAVSLRGFSGGAPGFQDYLGERYNDAAGRWEELYGKRVELTFGLDLFAATAREAQAGLDALNAALAKGGPEGLRPVEVTAGETLFQADARRYRCPVEAKFQAWCTAVAAEEGEFTDFTVKGEHV